MLFRHKWERARKLQDEENRKLHPHDFEEYDGKPIERPTIREEMEKGDMKALMLSAFLTIFPIASLALIVMVAIACLLFRIF